MAESSSGEGGESGQSGDCASEASGGGSAGLESMLSHGGVDWDSHENGSGGHSDAQGNSHGAENGKGDGHDDGHEKSHGGNKEGDVFEDTLDGSIALIVYENKDTIEFLVEKKPSNYYLKSEANKYSMIGGHMMKVNGVLENPLDTLVREIGEEVESKEAQKVLISHLNKDPSVYKVKDVDVNGERTKTYIYVIHITDGKEWGKVRPTRFTHDAGPAHVLSLGDLITLGKESFAFDDFWIFEEFSKSHFSEQYGNLRGSTDSHAHALPFSRYLPSSSFPLKRNSPPHPKEHIFGASQHRIGQRLENYFPVNSAYSFN